MRQKDICRRSTPCPQGRPGSPRVGLTIGLVAPDGHFCLQGTIHPAGPDLAHCQVVSTTLPVFLRASIHD